MFSSINTQWYKQASIGLIKPPIMPQCLTKQKTERLQHLVSNFSSILDFSSYWYANLFGNAKVPKPKSVTLGFIVWLHRSADKLHWNAFRSGCFNVPTVTDTFLSDGMQKFLATRKSLSMEFTEWSFYSSILIVTASWESNHGVCPVHVCGNRSDKVGPSVLHPPKTNVFICLMRELCRLYIKCQRVLLSYKIKFYFKRESS